MEEELSIKERLALLEERGYKKPKKIKKFKPPLRGRVNNNKTKKGYVTIITIQDNKTIDFTRERIIDGTIKLTKGDLSFHAIDPKDIFYYKGKPMIFQPVKKINPYNPLEGEHETYGQKYVMARMEGDKISFKKPMGWGIGIGALVIVAIIAYALITGG